MTAVKPRTDAPNGQPTTKPGFFHGWGDYVFALALVGVFIFYSYTKAQSQQAADLKAKSTMLVDTAAEIACMALAGEVPTLAKPVLQVSDSGRYVIVKPAVAESNNSGTIEVNAYVNQELEGVGRYLQTTSPQALRYVQIRAGGADAAFKFELNEELVAKLDWAPKYRAAVTQALQERAIILNEPSTPGAGAGAESCADAFRRMDQKNTTKSTKS